MSRWVISEALTSYRKLMTVIDSMTLADVEEALRLESESRRRKTLLARLASKAADLNQRSFKKYLKESINGTRQVGSPE